MLGTGCGKSPTPLQIAAFGKRSQEIKNRPRAKMFWGIAEIPGLAPVKKWI
jgi:hypothetical protein